MNRLLAKYKDYYNYARPHMTNSSEPPVHESIDIQPAEKRLRNLESIPWVGGDSTTAIAGQHSKFIVLT
jgi:hypothetical protein